MATNDVGVIDTFLNTFTTTIDSGFGLLKGNVVSLAGSLSVLDIALAGLFWAWAADEDIIQRLVKKTTVYRVLRIPDQQFRPSGEGGV
ncbi:hypothetical protein DmGdi_26640 [Gluconobacter sp. Gdi]|nr:hypothetical protein DmGdi_26640 [Gluconobacter sp. Gdi]